MTGRAPEVGGAPRIDVVARGGLDLEQRLRVVLGPVAEIVTVVRHEAERTGGRGRQMRNRFLILGRLIETLRPVHFHLPEQGQGCVARGPAFLGAIIRGEVRRGEVQVALDQVPDLARLRIADLRGRDARRHRGDNRYVAPVPREQEIPPGAHELGFRLVARLFRRVGELRGLGELVQDHVGAHHALVGGRPDPGEVDVVRRPIEHIVLPIRIAVLHVVVGQQEAVPPPHAVLIVREVEHRRVGRERGRIEVLLGLVERLVRQRPEGLGVEDVTAEDECHPQHRGDRQRSPFHVRLCSRTRW